MDGASGSDSHGAGMTTFRLPMRRSASSVVEGIAYRVASDLKRRAALPARWPERRSSC
jgi:hypothetical protein